MGAGIDQEVLQSYPRLDPGAVLVLDNVRPPLPKCWVHMFQANCSSWHSSELHNLLIRAGVIPFHGHCALPLCNNGQRAKGEHAFFGACLPWKVACQSSVGNVCLDVQKSQVPDYFSVTGGAPRSSKIIVHNVVRQETVVYSDA